MDDDTDNNHSLRKTFTKPSRGCLQKYLQQIAAIEAQIKELQILYKRAQKLLVQLKIENKHCVGHQDDVPPLLMQQEGRNQQAADSVIRG